MCTPERLERFIQDLERRSNEEVNSECETVRYLEMGMNGGFELAARWMRRELQ